MTDNFKKGITVTVALAGNPNVGKSTVFNALTGMKQHTGNWAGKTVGCAWGSFSHNERSFNVVDLPGCYSLSSNTGEEKIARDFLTFGNADAAITVCDGTCLERNLILALQTCEVHPKTVICVNLLDEAEKKGIKVDTEKLSRFTGVPVIGMSARNGSGLDKLKDTLCTFSNDTASPVPIPYDTDITTACHRLSPHLEKCAGELGIPASYLALSILKNDTSVLTAMLEGGFDINSNGELTAIIDSEKARLEEKGLTDEKIRESVFSSVIHTAEDIAAKCVSTAKETPYTRRARRLDRIFTGRFTAFPFMALLLALVLWITIEGANYPSAWLSDKLFRLQDIMYGAAVNAGWPEWLSGALILGVYRVLAWVVAVMLPPMAIFFPLFTLLEDFGYLPRIAFNLDSTFRRCRACGKQALTMCMGFGCNAVGVTGCRIIDSRRERMIAILTNVFVPCNGRFPTLIALITIFFVAGSGFFGGVLSTLMLTGVICLGIALTFAVSYILSKTLLKGVPSAFTLELPPYRTPQVGKVIVRSVFDRTLFVLGRAVSVAAPAGLVIWLCGYLSVGDVSLLTFLCNLLDPAAAFIGLDGVILLAFILGFPANEIVIPVMIMAYMQTSTVLELDNAALHTLLLANGWTIETALCVMIFCLCHWPCSTTLMTVYKETKSKKITALAAVIPTLTGILLCMLVHLLFTLLG